MKAMSTSRRFRPQLEEFEGRIVPSATLGAVPALAVAHTNLLLSPSPISPQAANFHGEIDGTWTTLPVANPLAGTTQALKASGAVTPLGIVQASGTLHLPGAAAQAYATGTLVLSNALGSITVALVGHQPSPVAAALPLPTFDFAINGGTGAYTGATGKGTAILTETPSDPSTSGKFTLTFKGSMSLAGPVHPVSGVSGVAMAGPITPVSHPGVPNEKPLPGAIITVQPAGGGKEITRIRADQLGRLRSPCPLALTSSCLFPLPAPPGRAGYRKRWL
jgi:hypothetical protein